MTKSKPFQEYQVNLQKRAWGVSSRLLLSHSSKDRIPWNSSPWILFDVFRKFIEKYAPNVRGVSSIIVSLRVQPSIYFFSTPFLPSLPLLFFKIFPSPLLTITLHLPWKFYCNPPLQTIFFKGTFFFSFNLKLKEKSLILNFLTLTCVNFYTLFLFNKLLIKQRTFKKTFNKTK